MIIIIIILGPAIYSNNMKLFIHFYFCKGFPTYVENGRQFWNIDNLKLWNIIIQREFDKARSFVLVSISNSKIGWW